MVTAMRRESIPPPSAFRGRTGAGFALARYTRLKTFSNEFDKRQPADPSRKHYAVMRICTNSSKPWCILYVFHPEPDYFVSRLRLVSGSTASMTKKNALALLTTGIKCRLRDLPDPIEVRCQELCYPNEKSPPAKEPTGLTLYSRDGGIRTHDPFNPIEVRYRAALRPEGHRLQKRHHSELLQEGL